VLAALDTGGDMGLMLLKERIDELEALYNQEADEKEGYMDDISDVRSELEIAEQRIKDLEAEAEKHQGKKKESDESMKQMAEQMAEYRLFKMKLETVQKENEIAMMKKRQELGELSHRLKKANERLLEKELTGSGDNSGELPPITEREEELLTKFDPDNIDMSVDDDEWKEQMNQRYNQLYRRLLREMQANRELRVSAAVDGQSGDKPFLGGQDGEAVVHDFNKTLEKKLETQKKQCDRLRKEIRSVEMRERYNTILRQNWQDQLLQAEKMLTLANQIHNRDRLRYTAQIKDRDDELKRLKTFVTKITKSRGNKSRRAGRRINNVMVPIKRKVSPVVRKIRKPSARN